MRGGAQGRDAEDAGHRSSQPGAACTTLGARRARRVHLPILAALALSVSAAQPAAGQPTHRNGFDITSSAVAKEEILAGGPPRDGIPALDRPPAVRAAEADWPDDSFVLGVHLAGEARAYPLGILTWHELVNDALGGRPILVSYCPLCGTGLVFDRRVGEAVLRFGVSGLLYRSDLLMFDRESESLWSQIGAEAVTGRRRGERLTLLRSTLMRWAAWRSRHPDTTVLSRETGHRRNYDRSPYAGYATSEDLLFPVPSDRRYHPKMPTLGLRVAGGPARGYPAAELVRAGGAVRERFAGHAVRVAYDDEAQRFDVAAPPELEVIEGYWFAWAAFHPDTTVFTGAGATAATREGATDASVRRLVDETRSGGPRP
jgi:hypothetical protein